MQFAPPRLRRSRENIVPMINVVFLLLIFFLMTAQIAPPAPFDTDPPASASRDRPEAPAVLHMAGDGTLAYRDARGEAVFAGLAGLERGSGLLIRADTAAPATDLATLLTKLAALGLGEVSLVTVAAP